MIFLLETYCIILSNVMFPLAFCASGNFYVLILSNFYPEWIFSVDVDSTNYPKKFWTLLNGCTYACCFT